jgi:hypothetical protein
MWSSHWNVQLWSIVHFGKYAMKQKGIYEMILLLEFPDSQQGSHYLRTDDDKMFPVHTSVLMKLHSDPLNCIGLLHVFFKCFILQYLACVSFLRSKNVLEWRVCSWIAHTGKQGFSPVGAGHQETDAGVFRSLCRLSQETWLLYTTHKRASKEAKKLVIQELI